MARFSATCLLMLFMLPLGCRSTSGVPMARSPQVQAFADQAALAEQQRDWQAATRVLAQAVEAAPNDANLQRRLAAAQFAAGNRTAALQTLQRASDLKPAGAEENAELAKLAVCMDELPVAEQAVQRALASDAGQVDALMLKAKIAERRNRPSEALAAYHQVLEVAPEHSPAKLKLAVYEIDAGQTDQAAVLLRSVCNCPLMTPQEKLDARRKLGLAYSREGRWPDAARELRRALSASASATADDWYQLAVAYRHLDRFVEARRAALRALQTDDRYQPARDLLAAIEQSQPASGPRIAATRR